MLCIKKCYSNQLRRQILESWLPSTEYAIHHILPTEATNGINRKHRTKTHCDSADPAQ